MNEKSEKKNGLSEEEKARNERGNAKEVCQKAPEFAEHHRLQDEDMPCEDGRGGRGVDEE